LPHSYISLGCHLSVGVLLAFWFKSFWGLFKHHLGHSGLLSIDIIAMGRIWYQLCPDFRDATYEKPNSAPTEVQVDFDQMAAIVDQRLGNDESACL
jgi:hypothetical protein